MTSRAQVHTCHALNCERRVPPRMHMCRDHWRMVPKALQRNLWHHYELGQEDTMTPSAEYLRAAAACVEAVARSEGQPEHQIKKEVATYIRWAEALAVESAATEGRLL